MAQIWQLNTQYRGIDATGTINGFPILNADTGGSGEAGFTSAALNPMLVGKGNLLRIEITQKTPDAELKCSVENAQTGDVIDTGNAEVIPLPAGDPPHVIEIRFDSPQDSFAKLLAHALPSDEKTMVAYALKLRDMLNAKDIDGMLKALQPKFSDLAEMYGVSVEMGNQQARSVIESFAESRQSFEAADVLARPCCDNKLWQLLGKDGDALFRIEEEDGSMSLDLVAAMMPEGPAVVR